MLRSTSSSSGATRSTLGERDVSDEFAVERFVQYDHCGPLY